MITKLIYAHFQGFSGNFYQWI